MAAVVVAFLGGVVVSAGSTGLGVSLTSLAGSVPLALIAFGLIGLWRAVVPSHAGVGSALVLVAGGALTAYRLRTGVPTLRSAVSFVVVVLLLTFVARATVGGHGVLRALFWSTNKVEWQGRLPTACSATVVGCVGVLDLSSARLVADTELNVTIVGGRLEIVIPSAWTLAPGVKALMVGMQMIEPESGDADTGQSRLKVNLLGIVGTLCIRRVR